jgi:hypothetical protein
MSVDADLKSGRRFQTGRRSESILGLWLGLGLELRLGLRLRLANR